METRRSQKPKLYVGDFVRIVKKEETFRKGYKQSFTDKVFEIAGIPTLNPPTYSLTDYNKEIIHGKYYQPELQLVRKSMQIKMSNNRFENEFRLHVISSASMNIFQENTLANIRNFFNDEIILIGEWL